MEENIINQELDTESRILAAAEREFLQKGYAGARTTSIAEAAGVTHAMLHYYFRTKERLFQKIMNKKLDQVAGAFCLNFGDENSDLFDALAKGISDHFDFFQANPDLPRFLISDILPNEEILNQLRDKIRDMAIIVSGTLQKRIDAAAAQGICRQVDARSLTIDIISLNIFPVLAAPILIQQNFPFFDYIKEDFLKARKQSNIDTIIRKLKP